MTLHLFDQVGQVGWPLYPSFDIFSAFLINHSRGPDEGGLNRTLTWSNSTITSLD